MPRTLLPNKCSYTGPTVNPCNWTSPKASIKKEWYFSYRYHDPLYNKEFPNGKLVIIKGMNHLRTQPERMQATAALLADELGRLKVKGFNPITQRSIPFFNLENDIVPDTPLTSAFKIAFKHIEAGKSTMADMRSMLTYINKAIELLSLNDLTAGQAKRKYILRILDACGQVKKQWSPHMYNKYRTYLLMLFKVMVNYEAIEANPVRDIEKKGVTQKIREVLTPEERIKVNNHLQKNHPDFHRYLHIFFHSGSRSTELFSVKVKDVQLSKQKYKVLIKKGKGCREVIKTIKNIALPFWMDLLKGTLSPEDYIFSKRLLPGKDKVDPSQVGRRWRVHVKDKLNITADFYCLKHLNTSEVVDALNDEDAAKLNAHEGTGMVVKIYDVKRKDRQHERLKKVNNEF